MILYAVAFPVVHFTVDALGISDEETQNMRTTFVIVLVLVMAAIAILYQRCLDRENRQLEATNRAVTEELQLSQRMEAVGRLAGGIAHDFNNVLQIVRACGDLARRSLGENAPQKKDLEMIGDAVDRAAALTDRLLTVSRRKNNEPEPPPRRSPRPRPSRKPAPHEPHTLRASG